MHLEEPWLIAIWPGMGSVALGAGTYLKEKLGAELLASVSARDYFEFDKVEIKDGVARTAWVPSCELFGWKNPEPGGRDLLIFIGEAQPSQRGYEFCRHLLASTERYGVSRVLTFAAMATQVHPAAVSRVFAVCNEGRLVEQLSREDVSILGEGQISGLNGVLLAAAAERHLEAVCLLGEIPFFAVGVPNPKGSCRVLEVFRSMSGIAVDLATLEEQARSMENHLVELVDRMKPDSDPGDTESEIELDVIELPDFLDDASAGPALSPGDLNRIENLFQLAAADRAKAFELKGELDRLGVFAEYEDRFLDLFKS